MKKKSDRIWTVIITALFIINGAPFILAPFSFIFKEVYVLNFAVFILIANITLPLAIISTITILFYLIKQRPHGAIRLISYTTLVISVFYVFYFLVLRGYLFHPIYFSFLSS
jgi:hypothetical protein